MRGVGRWAMLLRSLAGGGRAVAAAARRPASSRGPGPGAGRAGDVCGAPWLRPGRRGEGRPALGPRGPLRARCERALWGSEQGADAPYKLEVVKQSRGRVGRC